MPITDPDRKVIDPDTKHVFDPDAQRVADPDLRPPSIKAKGTSIPGLIDWKNLEGVEFPPEQIEQPEARLSLIASHAPTQLEPSHPPLPKGVRGGEISTITTKLVPTIQEESRASLAIGEAFKGQFPLLFPEKYEQIAAMSPQERRVMGGQDALGLVAPTIMKGAWPAAVTTPTSKELAKQLEKVYGPILPHIKSIKELSLPELRGGRETARIGLWQAGEMKLPKVVSMKDIVRGLMKGKRPVGVSQKEQLRVMKHEPGHALEDHMDAGDAFDALVKGDEMGIQFKNADLIMTDWNLLMYGKDFSRDIEITAKHLKDLKSSKTPVDPKKLKGVEEQLDFYKGMQAKADRATRASESFMETLEDLSPGETFELLGSIIKKAGQKIKDKSSKVALNKLDDQVSKLAVAETISSQMKRSVAIKTADGKVLHDPKVISHTQLLEENKLDPSKVKEGWMVNGKFYDNNEGAIKALLKGPEFPARETILGSERGSTGSMFRSFVEFWDPMHNLPQKEDYLALRYKTLGKINRTENLVQDTWKKLKGLDDQVKKDIFRYLDGQITKDALPQNVQAMANNLRTTNNLIGKMLVDRGLLPYETYVKNKDQYVRYMYLRHVLDDSKPLPIGANGRLDLKYLKARKDLTKDQRKALGLIEDVSVAEPMTMSKSLTDVAKFDNLLKISLNSEWTWQGSLVKVGDRTFGIGALADEISVYRNMVRKAPNSPEIRQQLASMEHAYNQARQAIPQVPANFRQLPNTKAYGPLAGAYIRTEIVDDITPVFNGIHSRTESAKLFNAVLDLETKGMAMFKVTKTALNLPTAARNTISNMIQLNMSGMNLAEISTGMVGALQSMLKKDMYWGQAMRNGLFKTNWAEGEINEVLKQVRQINPSSYSSVTRGMTKIAGFYGKIDDVFKLTKYMHELKKGAPIEKAIQEAQKWGMDYSLADPSVKLLRRHIMPFMSYQYKIAPLIIESIAKRPWVIAKYLAIPVASYEIFKQTNDIDAQQWERMMKQLPTYIKETGSQMVLPHKDAKGNWQWINLEYFFPWQAYKQVGEDIGRGNLTKLPQDIGVSNPVLSMAIAIGASDKEHPPKDPFTHREIYSILDPPKAQAAKFTEWTYNQFMPTMLTRQGALGNTLSIGDKTRFGHEITAGESAARWLGVNVTTISPKQHGAEIAGKRRGLKDALNRIMKDPTISREKKQIAIKQYQQKLREAIQ